MTDLDAKILGLLIGGRDYLARPDVELNQDGGFFADDSTKCCGLGAVMAAAGFRHVWSLYDATGVPYRLIRTALDRAVPESSPHRVFPYFNDHIAESKDDVLAVFDRAIADLRAAQL